MFVHRMFWSMAAALVSLAAPFCGAALAEDLIVEHNPSSGHYATIQAAIDHATSVLSNPGNTTSFRIMVKADPVPYTGPITPISNVPIIGSSTSGTFLTGNGAGTLMNLSNVNSVTIRNLTFRSASVGIAVANSSSINITNNVFEVGTAGVAVSVTVSPSTSIINNTFVRNGTAISTDSDIAVSNDIFFSNTTAISTQVSLTALSYSFFFSNAGNGVSSLGSHSIPNSQVPNQSPLFVDQGNRDYHLQSGSAAKGSGNPNYPNSFDSSFDMGAYGGPNADPQVTTVTGISSSLSGSTMTVNWTASSSPAVTAYRVYYGTASRTYDGTQAAEGPSPITVSASATTATLSGLPLTPPAVPSPPATVTISPFDQALMVTWSPSPGATGYRVYYKQSTGTAPDIDPSSPPTTYLDVQGGNMTSATISGLTNGQHYTVAVAALAQAKFYAAVTAVIDASAAAAPDSGNESPYSAETSQAVGPLQESALSVQANDFPEPFEIYPFFSVGSGCFIATAAYGSYLAPQVQLLRTFRDSYLTTNAPGRAFVAWYYHYGPYAARYIDDHPWLKVPVRLALLPLLALAAFLVYTPPAAQLALLIFTVSVAAALYVRRRRSAPANLEEAR